MVDYAASDAWRLMRHLERANQHIKYSRQHQRRDHIEHMMLVNQHGGSADSHAPHHHQPTQPMPPAQQCAGGLILAKTGGR